MGLHMAAVVAAKLHLQVLATHGGGVGQSLISPAVAAIACPLALKLFLSFRILREEALHATTLFFFRLGQILFNTRLPFANRPRLERALRLLLSQTPTPTLNSPPSDDRGDDDTLHILSMLTL
ncbi:hypothetical protein PIB30_019705 [Stylosanthes scabra]|uniref:Uncharacterized protein n=1 Tax=Stylosanthes scabra TaxID=79078 RepID=A0ABU6U7K1_9FABA|nr:hypothetical protein [Stylosanthes scabra]